jgi:hypothetical protein
MAIRDKIVENAKPFLGPGEQVQAAFAAQTFSQYWFLLSWIIVLVKNSFRSVVVTDRRILVLNTGKWSATKAKSVLRELPRSTQIGTPSGLWWRTDALGERLYVHKRFHKDVVAANELAPAPGSPMAPPGYSTPPVAGQEFPPPPPAPAS